jgi:hypothetical protein
MKNNPLFKAIKKDHRHIRSLSHKLKKTTPRSIKRREELIGELAALLESHVKAEEHSLYRHVMSGPGKLHELAMAGYAEHHEADNLLKEILILRVNDDQWMPKVEVLAELIRHHLDEEELELFPKTHGVFSDMAFQRMSDDFFERRKNHTTAHSIGTLWSQAGPDNPQVLH